MPAWWNSATTGHTHRTLRAPHRVAADSGSATPTITCVFAAARVQMTYGERCADIIPLEALPLVRVMAAAVLRTQRGCPSSGRRSSRETRCRFSCMVCRAFIPHKRACVPIFWGRSTVAFADTARRVLYRHKLPSLPFYAYDCPFPLVRTRAHRASRRALNGPVNTASGVFLRCAHTRTDMNMLRRAWPILPAVAGRRRRCTRATRTGRHSAVTRLYLRVRTGGVIAGRIHLATPSAPARAAARAPLNVNARWRFHLSKHLIHSVVSFRTTRHALHTYAHTRTLSS